MRWRNGLLTASSALLLAGCGGGRQEQPPAPPRIPAALAARLAAEADQVAAQTPGTCTARDAAARFRRHVTASIGSVPVRYREPLASAATDLARRLAACTPPPPPQVRGGEKRGEHGHGHGKKHGKKHRGGNGNEGGDEG